MTSRDRIIQFVEYKKISKNKFYKETGLSNGFLDKNNHPGADKLEQIIYTYPNISPEWLLTGKGEMLRGVEPPAPSLKGCEIKPDANVEIIRQQAEQIGELKSENRHHAEQIKKLRAENEHKNEQIKELKAEIEHLKNDVRELRSDIDEPRGTVVEVRKMPLIPPCLEPPMYEYNHPE